MPVNETLDSQPLTMKRNKPDVYLPEQVYDLSQWLMFPMNYAIGGLCNLQPNESVWNEGYNKARELRGSAKPVEIIAREILEQQDIAYEEEDLVRLYDSLPSVDAESDLVGRSWQGKVLRTNASVLDIAEWLLIRPLSLLGLNWGKRYRNANVGDPLLVRWKDEAFFPVPAWGNVGMTNIEWRDDSTATMNYDHQPWKDYFKMLSNDDGKMVLLGVWTHKHIAGGWFTLTFDAELPTS